MDGIDTYKLDNGASCKIAAGWGCNLFSWKVDGKELMYCPEDLPSTAEKITGGGNPILFPSVGRTWDRSSRKPVPGLYRISGSDETYFMPSHGIVFQSKFVKTGESRSADRLIADYELIVPEKVRAENFPFDLKFIQRFTLTPTTIELRGTITNTGDSMAPAAFGYHPYFRISDAGREGVEARLPVSKRLLLTQDTVLPTGESEEADGVIDLNPDIYYDHAFCGRTGRRMSLIDRKAERAIHVDCDETFEMFVLYAPDGAEFVCIEPWTRGLGAYEHLRNPGWENGEVIPVLRPGEVRTHAVTFSVSALEK